MEKKDVIKLIEYSFSATLMPIGFIGTEEKDGYNLSREVGLSNQLFSFAFTTYDNWFKINLTSGSFQFHPVEDLLFKYLEKKTDSFQRVKRTFRHNYYFITDTRDISIYNESDFNKLVPEWNIDIKEKIIPFFEEWNDLKKINDEIINKVSPKELSRYILGETSFKKMIIMKLCNNPNYQQYINQREEALEKAKGKSEKYLAYYNLFCELKKELESIEPLYT